MKIALVSNTSWSIYNFRLGLIKHLQSKGVEVIVIAPRDNFTSQLIKEKVQFHEIRVDNYSTNPIKEINILRQLRRIYKREKPNLIFHYTIKPNIYGSIAAFLTRIPSIAITTGLGHLFEFKNHFVRLLTFLLYRVACICAKEVWFLNKNDQDVFVYKRMIKRKNSRILPSEGVDINWFKVKQEKNYDQEDIFLFAGRLLKDKGIIQYINAAKILRKKGCEAKFYVLGFINQENPNSITYEELRNWQKQGTIEYLGETTDVRDYIEDCTCLVFPTYYREGVSRILLEAASMETPIITTDNVGCDIIVDHNRNGYLTVPKDVSSLVSALESFMKLAPADKRIMGKLGRKKVVREFSEKVVFKTYDAAIEDYLGRANLKRQKKNIHA